MLKGSLLFSIIYMFYHKTGLSQIASQMYLKRLQQNTAKQMQWHKHYNVVKSNSHLLVMSYVNAQILT